jgi:branched-chain amino acid transport system ATP-binding protein
VGKLFAEAILEVERVTMAFDGLRALDDVSLQLRRGEILGLIGPNGAGKTTMFNVIAGVCRPTHG